ALLIALGVYLGRGPGTLQHDAWFASLRMRLSAWLQGRGLQLAAVLLPVLVVGLAYLWAGRVLHGLVELAILVASLLFAFGRGNLGEALTGYLERWARGDFQAAHQMLAEEAEPGEITGPAALHVAARRRLYYRAFERVFGVLFWFVLAGPAGAVGYRLVQLEKPLSDSANTAAAGERFPLPHWADWLPARLLALAFALVGDFDACLERWRLVVADTRIAAVELLERCGNAALRFVPPPEPEAEDALRARGAAELQGIELLHQRALVVWMVVIALLAMVG
ncbi:MAG: regulatory signaling modulator protein AmpE, partial [Gammaproteobacteria bacterium]